MQKFNIIEKGWEEVMDKLFLDVKEVSIKQLNKNLSLEDIFHNLFCSGLTFLNGLFSVFISKSNLEISEIELITPYLRFYLKYQENILKEKEKLKNDCGL